MPSLEPLRTKTQAFLADSETSDLDRDYATGLLAEIEAVAAQLVPLQQQLAAKIAAKDELAVQLEAAKVELRSLNAVRDPLSAKMNELLFKLGNVFGDTIGIGGGFRG